MFPASSSNEGFDVICNLHSGLWENTALLFCTAHGLEKLARKVFTNIYQVGQVSWCKINIILFQDSVASGKFHSIWENRDSSAQI